MPRCTLVSPSSASCRAATETDGTNWGPRWAGIGAPFGLWQISVWSPKPMGLAQQCADAVQCIRGACVATGILASVEERANYRRVWTRDGVIAGLAGVVIDDAAIIDALGATLRHVATLRGPHGEIPSNVASAGEGAVSYGGLAGRVDAGAWFTIGAFHYLERRPDSPDRRLLLDAARGALDLYERWEFNARGLVYVPLGGTWADEYPIHGYTLTEQLLRIWALRGLAHLLGDERLAGRAKQLTSLVGDNYWTGDASRASTAYHPVAFARSAEAKCTHFWAALSPAGYDLRFDALANALAILLGVGERGWRQRALESGEVASRESGATMVPAFWPPIAPGDALFEPLANMAAHGFRNHPGQYHNGGLWPMVNGFWGSALCAMGQEDRARDLLQAITSANRDIGGGGDFSECHSVADGPGGTPRCTWSAAGEVLLACHLSGQKLLYFSEDEQ